METTDYMIPQRIKNSICDCNDSNNNEISVKEKKKYFIVKGPEPTKQKKKIFYIVKGPKQPKQDHKIKVNSNLRNNGGDIYNTGNQKSSHASINENETNELENYIHFCLDSYDPNDLIKLLKLFNDQIITSNQINPSAQSNQSQEKRDNSFSNLNSFTDCNSNYQYDYYYSKQRKVKGKNNDHYGPKEKSIPKNEFNDNHPVKDLSNNDNSQFLKGLLSNNTIELKANNNTISNQGQLPLYQNQYPKSTQSYDDLNPFLNHLKTESNSLY